ncbi:MAG: ABC transporter permease [Bryobacteraceae bacterium]
MTATQNVRYALRAFARNPGFTVAAVLCLMLGIGATTAIFSVVNAVVLRPLPYAHADRLVRVFTEFPTFPNGGLRHFWLSPPEYLELKREAKSYEDLEGWVNGGVNLAGAAQPVRAQASFVTGGLLSMLGMNPLIGRQLTVTDDAPNAPATAVLSFGLWQRAYGGERSILGRDIQLDGRPCTVVGVMPPSFDFPPGETDPVELWTPLQIDPARPGGRGSHFLSILARLHQGVTLSQAQSEMTRYAAQSSATTAPANHPFDPKRHPIVLADFQDEVVKGVRPAMLVLLGAVGFVLLIACVNVANLLLARAEGRRREIAVRAAVGAGMGNLVWQFITEGVLLSFAGGALGTLLAIGGLRLLAATNAGSIPRAGEIDIDWQVLAFTLSISLLTGIAFGLAPLLHLKLATLAETLKATAGRNSGDASTHAFRFALVTSELALAMVLLVGAGLMVKAFWKLQQVDAGVRPDHVLTMRINLPQTAYGNVARVRNFWGSLLGNLGSLPGVAHASMTNGLPPNRRINANDTPIEGFVPVPNGPMQNIDYWNIVSPNYLDAVGARLIEGRTLNANDGVDAPAVVVINQTMARVFWPHGALGHRLRVGGADTPWRTIVGVVADIKNAGVDRPTGTELFVPYQQYPFTFSTAYLAIRTQGDPMAMVNAVRAQVQALDRALPVSSVRSLEDVLSANRSRPRFLTMILTLFSSLSLVLAALGIYGVISYAVAQRTSEIGIRMALGAQTGDVLRMIGSTGMRLALAGTTAGAIGAFALTRFMDRILFGVSAVDVTTFLSMAGVLILVTLLACYVPARRASKVDPLIALRYD